MTQSLPVGVCVIILRKGKVLLGKRGPKSFYSDHWCCPGGKLEPFESVEECAEREVFEETGLKIKNLKKLALNNDPMPEVNKHYLTHILKAEHAGGELTINEPEKFIETQWFEVSKLPKPLFPPTKKALERFKAEK